MMGGIVRYQYLVPLYCPGPMSAFSHLVSVGLAHHRAGDLDRAEPYYRHVIAHDPGHADAWHLLGVLANQRGRPEQALDYLGRALALKPGEAGFHLNRGVALQALGRLEEAAASFRNAAEAKPDFAEAHNNLANALHTLGRHDAAVAHWQRALTLQPAYAEERHNLAVALYQRGALEEAASHARAALQLRPDFAPAHLTLGNALGGLQRYEEAEACYREALRRRPDLAVAHGNLAHVLRMRGRREEALASARQALALAPASSDAHNAAGAVLGGLGRAEEAAAHLRHALGLRPDHPEAHNNLGVLLSGQRQFAEAAAHFTQALLRRPDLTDASLNLARALARLGELDGAVAAVREALRHHPESAAAHSCLGELLAQQGRLAEAEAAFREALRLQPDLAVAHSSLLIALNFDPRRTPADLLAEHRRWEERQARVEVLGPAPGHDRDPGRRLRVGYVSPDLVRHVLCHFFEPILAHHDAREVEAVCYADALFGDAVTERLRGLVARWQPIHGQGDAEVAERVRADGIDVLVDLAGHTGGRLGVFARRPAPVQLTYLGYPTTTGLAAMHYRLTDAVADPPGEAAGHTEELVRLPGGFCCYAPPADAPPVAPSPAQGRGYVTFGSLHKLGKLNDRVLDLWCAALRAAPSARLLVFRDTLRGSARDYFREQFARRGVPEGRVILGYQVEGDQSHLTIYRDIDVLLDAFPWGGHATACEALWMGVPVLTLRGERHAGRMVASVLTQVGLTEFIAGTPEAFVARAAGLAADAGRLVALRAGLRDQVRASPLCDGAGFTRRLEAAYRALWQRWARGEAAGGPGPGQ
jgi:predicted O-linked N-acetylglucosamine transferase (SPINDLY family)